MRGLVAFLWQVRALSIRIKREVVDFNVSHLIFDYLERQDFNKVPLAAIHSVIILHRFFSKTYKGENNLLTYIFICQQHIKRDGIIYG